MSEKKMAGRNRPYEEMQPIKKGHFIEQIIEQFVEHFISIAGDRPAGVDG